MSCDSCTSVNSRSVPWASAIGSMARPMAVYESRSQNACSAHSPPTGSTSGVSRSIAAINLDFQHAGR
jgi:hypothetical protein